jgi:ornithine decarboxylase
MALCATTAPTLLLILSSIGRSSKQTDKLHFAVKCNPDPHVIKVLAEAGTGFEMASPAELDLLLSLGISPEDIIYSAPVKAAAAIAYAYAKGIRCFAFDSPEELDKLAAHAPGAKVIVRLKVSERKSVFSLARKFGTVSGEALQMMLTAQSLGLIPYGITFNVGSQAMRVTAWADGLKQVGQLMRQLQRHRVSIGLVNLGGGFPVSYQKGVPDWESIGRHVRAAFAQLPYRPKLVAEPGRALVAHSGKLVASVIHRTRRGNENWLFLDVGAYNGLFEALACQGSIRYPISAGVEHTSAHLKFVVTGPTCDSLDTIDHGVYLPADIAVGDQVTIENVGAYSLCFATSFNGFGPPKVYLK